MGRGVGGDQERLPRGGSARDEHQAGTDRQKALQEEGEKRAKVWGWDGLGQAPDTVGTSEETSLRKSQTPTEWMFLFFHGHTAVKKKSDSWICPVIAI